MSNKVGLTLKAKFNNGRSVSGGGAVFHSERARKEDRLNLKTEPNTITLYRHGLEQIDKSDSKAVFGFFKDLEQDTKDDYQAHSHRNRKWQDRNELFYEGIIAFGRNQFEQMNDPQKVMDYCISFCNTLEQKTGAKIHMVSLHLDEGHLDENKILQHNYHAHFLLTNYNQETHKSALRNAKILVDEYRTEIKTYTNKAGETKQKTVKTKEATGNKIAALYDFKQIQNDLGTHFAELGFERGRDYSAEGLKCPKNIDHRQYSELKTHEQQILNEINQEFRTEIKPINDFGEELGIEFEDAQGFVDGVVSKVLDPLAPLCKIFEVDNPSQELENVQQLADCIVKKLSAKDQIIEDFKAQLTQKNTEFNQLKEFYTTARAELVATKEAKQVDYQELKKLFEAQKLELNTTSQQLNQQKTLNLDLSIEVKTLKTAVEVLQISAYTAKTTELSQSYELKKQISNELTQTYKKDYQPTFTRKEVNHAQLIAKAVDSYTKRINPLKSMYEWEIGDKVMTPKEFKQEHEQLTQARVLAIDKLESRIFEIDAQRIQETSELAKSLATTNQKLVEQAKINGTLLELNTELKTSELAYKDKYSAMFDQYCQKSHENNKLTRKIAVFEATQGLKPQEVQEKLTSQSETISHLKLKTENLEATKNRYSDEVTNLKAKNTLLQAENTELKSAVEQFLNLAPIKRITKVSKSLVGRFNEGLNGIKNYFNQLETEKISLTKELSTTKDHLTTLKTDLSAAQKDLQLELLKTAPQQLKTTEDVLAYFKKLRPDEMKTLVIEDNDQSKPRYKKELTISGKSYNYLTPHKIAETLSKHLNLENPLSITKVVEVERSHGMGFSR